MVKVYAFDVDECMETSNGPITVNMLRELHEKGDIVGLCGNLRAFIPIVPDWHRFISFTLNFGFDVYTHVMRIVIGGTGTVLIPKAIWLHCFRDHCPGAEDYIMEGNEFGRKNSLGYVCGSHDKEAAEQAGWRFILEDDFVKGER